MKLSRIALPLFLSLIAFTAFGQKEIGEGSDWKDRIFVGGGFGMNGGNDGYGNRYFYVELSPIIGYMLTQQLSAGTGISYTYYRYADLDLSLHEYGASPFIRYNINQFFGMVEYNFISVPNFNDQSVRKIYDRLLGGVGISQPLGKAGSINFAAMYDFLYESTGPFGSPWVFRVYFAF